MIGEFLGRLHRLPLDAVEGFLPREHETLAEWLTDAGEDYARVVDRVPRSLRGPIESFLATPPPPDAQVAAITDPAYDLVLLYRDLGAEALTSVLDHYQGAPEPIEDLRLRAEFYARCSVFEDVAYGLDPGHDLYLAQGPSALEHLFRQ